MATNAGLKCENCDCELGRLEDAFVWLDKPVCKPCFKHLSSTRSIRFRGFWMPLAIATTAIAFALGCILAIALARNPNALLRGPQAAQNVSNSAEAVSGPSRSDILSFLQSDRTWYWHWEQKNKDKPFKFVVDNNGGITMDSAPTKPVTMEERWVLMADGHCLVPIDEQTIHGFFIQSGRQVGAFTEQALPK